MSSPALKNDRRELDEALGLTTMIEPDFCDNRKGKNTQRNLIALLRQSIYGRLAGYEDTNDAERLSIDPAMRKIAEKLEFMKARAAKVCAKVGIGRKVRHKKPCIPANFQ